MTASGGMTMVPRVESDRDHRFDPNHWDVQHETSF